MKQLKKKKCQVTTCRELFVPRSGLQVVCDWQCAIDLKAQKAAEKAAKTLRGERKVFRDNDRAYQLTLAQAEFNAWIRYRDRHDPCISCGTTSTKIQYAAGHYRTIKSLRFDEDNCHKQCNVYCNQMKSANIVEYRISLIKKIGLKRVEAIEGKNQIHKFTLEEIVAIRDKYKRLNKEAS